MIINGIYNVLIIGRGVIMPAYVSNNFQANERFKMISTAIKSGYEEGAI